MKKYFAITVILPFLLALSKSVFAAHQKDFKKIRIGIWEHPPYMREKDSKNDYGYCYSLVSHILKKAGYKTTPYYAPLATLAKQASAERLEAICAHPKTRPEDFFYSSQPILRLRWKVWMKKGMNFNFEGVKSYKKLRIVKGDSWNYQEAMPLFQKAIDEGAKEYVVRGRYAAKRAFMLIDSGRADIVGLDESHAKYILKNNDFENEFKAVPTEKGLQSANFAVSRKWESAKTLLKAFEDSYSKAIEDGTVDRFKEKYQIAEGPTAN